MKELIGKVEMEITFRGTKGKDFEEIKDKMFNFLLDNFFKNKEEGLKILRGYDWSKVEEEWGQLKYYSLDLTLFDNFLTEKFENVSKRLRFKDFNFYITYRYDMYDISTNEISIGNNEHIEIDSLGVRYDPYYKYYKDLNVVLKNIDNGKHIPTVFYLSTLRYFNEIYKYNNKK